jgi:hypothetical protein
MDSGLSDADELPSVGRVWEGGGATSVFAAFKKAAANRSNANSPTPDARLPNHASTAQVDASVTSIDTHDLAGLMSRLRLAAVAEQPTVGAFLDGASIIAYADDCITIEYPKNLEQSAKMLDRNGKRENLQEVLSRLTGRATGIRFSISDRIDETPRPAPLAGRPAPKPTPAAEPLIPQQTGINITEQLRVELLTSVPLVKALADTFNARLVKVEEGD